MSWFERDSHTGDAVLIAPVSSQIPCKQGFFQGIRKILALERLASMQETCTLQRLLAEFPTKVIRENIRRDSDSYPPIREKPVRMQRSRQKYPISAKREDVALLIIAALEDRIRPLGLGCKAWPLDQNSAWTSRPAHLVQIPTFQAVAAFAPRACKRDGMRMLKTDWPLPESYEEEYRTWPWGALIDHAADIVLSVAPPGAAVLDYMCATGFLLNAISMQRNDLVLHGCEIHEPFVTYARHIRPALEIVHADALAFRPDRTYDVVLCTGGVHHLPFELQERFLDKICDECSPGGTIVIGEEAFRPYASEQERIASAVDLNTELILAGVERGCSLELMFAGLDLLRDDVLARGEYKRNIHDWTSIISRRLELVDIVQTWKPESGGGDFLFICRENRRGVRAAP